MSRRVRMRASGWITCVCSLCLVLGWSAGVRAEGTARPMAAGALPDTITLEPGEIRNVTVHDVTRVAIGKPEVVDITVVSANELLLQAKKAGSSGLIVWDRQGQHVSSIDVVDHATVSASSELRRLLDQLGYKQLRIEESDGKLFLAGDVAQQAELDRLEQLLSKLPNVTSLVGIASPPPPSTEAAPLVQLAVQVLEMNRTDLEQLGVKWSESVKFTEPATEATNRSIGDALLRWGNSVNRTDVSAAINALVRKNKARVLSEPKLVTSSGKEASSFIGLDVPILTATSFSTTTAASTANIEFRKTGVLLKMTPQVPSPNPEARVTVVVEAEVSGVDRTEALKVPVGTTTAEVPGFKVRKANTEVSATSGESIVIAGLLALEDNNNLDQVPALGSLPIVGRLFRAPEVKSTQQEIVIVLTPLLLASRLAAVAPASSEEAPLSMEDRLAVVQQSLALMERSSAADPATMRYGMLVKDRIAQAIIYPAATLDMGRPVLLRIHLAKDGTLSEATVAQSSGSEAFDQAVLQAAHRQSPYPPFPSELSQQDLWLDVPVLFRQ